MPRADLPPALTNTETNSPSPASTLRHTMTHRVPFRLLAASTLLLGLTVTGLAPGTSVPTGTDPAGSLGAPAPGLGSASGPGGTAADLAPASATTGSIAGRTIVLDPAAGSVRKGVSARRSTACDRPARRTRNGVSESTVTMDTAKRLSKKLRRAGATVVYTRTGAGAVCATQRATLANTAGAALKISIETSDSRSGVSVLAPKSKRGSTDDIYAASRTAAKAARDGVKRQRLPRSGKGLKYIGSLASLNLSDVPAIAVSAGNVGNLKDALRMTSVRGQKSLAKALAGAAMRLFNDPSFGSGPGADAAGGGSGTQLGVQVFSMWNDWEVNERLLDAVAASGSRWIRFDVGWCTLEEAGPGQISGWYQDRLDRAVAAARARGINLLVTVACGPSWAVSGGQYGPMPVNPAEYARIMSYLATRYRGQVAAWELWNEPDCQGGCGNGSAEQYAELLKAAYPATKAADPAATVMNGGLSGIDLGWIKRLFKAGAGSSMDALALHPYLAPANAGPETAAVSGYTNPYRMMNIPAAADLVAELGRPGLPMWFTEFGWTTGRTEGPYDGVSAATQAAYLTASMAILRARFPFVTHAFWFMMRDRVDNTAYENGFGLFNADLSPKPAYAAFAAAARG